MHRQLTHLLVGSSSTELLREPRTPYVRFPPLIRHMAADPGENCHDAFIGTYPAMRRLCSGPKATPLDVSTRSITTVCLLSFMATSQFRRLEHVPTVHFPAIACARASA